MRKKIMVQLINNMDVVNKENERMMTWARTIL